METIQNKIEILRKWFIENDDLNEYVLEVIDDKFKELTVLLEEGEKHNMVFYPAPSYGSAKEYLITNFSGRIKKIINSDNIILTSEPDLSTSDLYQMLRETVIIQLYNHQDTL